MPAVVQISSPPRGSATQAAVSFQPSEYVCTWSWGLQPATALIDWVSARAQAALIPNAAVTITVGGHTFYGLSRKVTPVLGADGYSVMQEFVDSRDYLMWDVVYGAFNQREHVIVNGVFVRRYWHILPADFNRQYRTYTTTPYTAREILDFLFGAATVESPWVRVYHAALDNPVYELDFLGGRKLGTAVLEISEALGTVFTLLGGRYRLVWAVKGVGTLPSVPANATNIRNGRALSGNPTRLRVLGERNLYQVLNVDLEADWKPAWQQFFDFNAFVRNIFLNESTEAAFGSIPAGTAYTAIDAGNDNNAGYLLAEARARTITVGQYANLRDRRAFDSGEAFRDYRKFGGRSRLQMPVIFYLSNILFRAFRVPAGFFLRNADGDNVPLAALELVERAIVEVTHDPATGLMSYDPGAPASDHNGYAIARGYQVASDAFKTLNPQYFDVDRWRDQQAVWQALPFHIDNSGEGSQFVLFDEPVIRTDDLVHRVEIETSPGVVVAQAAPALWRLATVQVPPVRASLTFAAEKFSRVQGVGTRDDVVNVGGLSGEFVAFANHNPPIEQPYGNGEYAWEKAQALADTLLNRQYYYDFGGYTVQGCNATQLTSMIDRVSVRYNATGLTEEVDWTSERAQNVAIGRGGQFYLQPTPEREYERRAQLDPLLPGQRELRQSANQLRAKAAFLLKHPRINRNLVETFHRLLGLDAPPERVLITDGAGNLPAGTPLFREYNANNPVLPDNTIPPVLTAPVFVGVTVVDEEAADGPVRTTVNGSRGIIYARVKGPVEFQESVGLPEDTGDGLATDYLQTSAHTEVGRCLAAWADTTIKLVPVRTTGGGGGGGDPVWLP